MFTSLHDLTKPWTWIMAWRDTRSSRSRLFLFSISIVVGISALTAIDSFRANMEQVVEDQAKSLLGADLMLASRSPFTEEEERFFASMGGDQSRQIGFSSMVYFPRSEGTRLVQVRGLSGAFPYYGTLVAEPPAAAETFRQGGGALVEESLMIQYGVQVGDTLQVGELSTRIAGKLKKVPGETVLFSTIAPRIYLSMEEVQRTGLLREGSLAAYRVYFHFPPDVDVAALASRVQERADQFRLRLTTVEERKKDLGESIGNMDTFLNLTALVALVLGGVGVASAVHVHIKQKTNTIALLRCLGGTVRQTFTVYLLQACALGAGSATLGVLLGMLVQRVLPLAVADFVPFEIPIRLSWGALAQGWLIGFMVCLSFALLPLLQVRRVPPLVALRASYELADRRRRDPMFWWLAVILALGLAGLALLHSQEWKQGLALFGGIATAFAVLLLVASSMTLLVKRFTLSALPFVLRQGLANLHRPQNRTVLMVLSIGLGTFMILTLYLTKDTLMTQLVSPSATQQPNTILFDIQPDQREAVIGLLQEQNLPVLDQAPVITMRIASVRGRAAEAILADKGSPVPGWTLRREYRSTYNSTMRSGEKLLSGTWHTTAPPDARPIPVSVEEGIAKELGVGLGDELVFDVQGVDVPTVVASLRQVDWRRVQPNFFVVFPEGTLADAPAFHVLVTRVTSPEQSAQLQKTVVQQFPNVSAIDLTLILSTLEAVLGKVAFAVRFMAIFTVATGLLVLAGSIMISRYQRIQESVLLRVLGASGRQCTQILLTEYLALGLLAALAGTLLAVGATWALAHFAFKISFGWPLLPVLACLLLVPALTVVIGWTSSRGILRQSPLSVLRQEG